MLRFEMFESKNFSTSVPYGDPVSIEGPIVEEVDKRLDHQKITVKSEYGKILLNVGLYENLSYGDHIHVEGVLKEPEIPYKNYLSVRKIRALINPKYFEVIEKGEADIWSLIYSFKNKLQIRINRIYFEPEAAFASGLLLGARKGMSEEITNALKVTGLTHIVAISGYNISLLIIFVFSIFSFLKIKIRIILSVFLLFIFVVMVGASASVVRAAIMGSLTLLGIYSGRKSQVLFALLWSCLIMVFINPYILFYDLGFQLSFASTFGLVTLNEFFNRLSEKIKIRIPEALVMTLSAQIATFPFISLNFGTFSLISPLTNLLVAPFLPFAMLFSGLSLIFGKFAGVFAVFYLKSILFIAVFFSKMPFAQIELKFTTTTFVFFLIALCAVLIIFYKQALCRAFFRGPVQEFEEEEGLELQRHVK